MKDLKICLENYLKVLKTEDKIFKEKYKKEKTGHQSFTYDREKMKKISMEEHIILRNKSEQKLHINRLLKLINQIEILEKMGGK